MVAAPSLHWRVVGLTCPPAWIAEREGLGYLISNRYQLNRHPAPPPAPHPLNASASNPSRVEHRSVCDYGEGALLSWLAGISRGLRLIGWNLLRHRLPKLVEVGFIYFLDYYSRGLSCLVCFCVYFSVVFVVSLNETLVHQGKRHALALNVFHSAVFYWVKGSSQFSKSTQSTFL
jgi:hypothetical protein